MSPEFAEFLPLILVMPLLTAMALRDMQKLRISNQLVLAMGAVFVLTAPLLLPLSDIGYRTVTAILIYLLGLAGFALKLWGGGDVKAMSTLALFLPSSTLIVYLSVFSASMLIGLTIVMSLRAVVGTPDSPWLSLRPQTGFPMGLSIALSGVLLLTVKLVSENAGIVRLNL